MGSHRRSGRSDGGLRAHGRNADSGDVPDLAAFAGGQTGVCGARAGCDGVAETGVRLSQGDGGVEIQLVCYRAGAVAVAFGASAISSESSERVSKITPE